MSFLTWVGAVTFGLKVLWFLAADGWWGALLLPHVLFGLLAVHAQGVANGAMTDTRGKRWVDVKCTICHQPYRVGVQSLEDPAQVKAEPYECCECRRLALLRKKNDADSRAAA